MPWKLSELHTLLARARRHRGPLDRRAVHRARISRRALQAGAVSLDLARACAPDRAPRRARGGGNPRCLRFRFRGRAQGRPLAADRGRSRRAPHHRRRARRADAGRAGAVGGIGRHRVVGARALVALLARRSARRHARIRQAQRRVHRQHRADRGSPCPCSASCSAPVGGELAAAWRGGGTWIGKPGEKARRVHDTTARIAVRRRGQPLARVRARDRDPRAARASREAADGLVAEIPAASPRPRPISTCGSGRRRSGTPRQGSACSRKPAARCSISMASRCATTRGIRCSIRISSRSAIRRRIGLRSFAGP